MRKIVYIAGIGRNGGTLLDRTLGQVDDFFSLGELRFIWQKGVRDKELCNCHQAFDQCEFWKEVMKDVELAAMRPEDVIDLYMKVDRTRFLPYHMLPLLQGKKFKRNVRDYQSIINRLYDRIFSVADAKVLVDSSKFVGHGLFLARIPDVEFHVVHLVRDSRATAYSWMKKRRKQEVVGKEAYMRQYGCASSSFQWLYRNVLSEALKKESSTYTVLRYEDFCKDPRQAVSNVLSRIGETDKEASFIEGKEINLQETHTQSGNPSRFIEGAVKVRADNEWEEQMRMKDKVVSSLISLPGLFRYKYKVMK